MGVKRQAGQGRNRVHAAPNILSKTKTLSCNLQVSAVSLKQFNFQHKEIIIKQKFNLDRSNSFGINNALLLPTI